MITMLILVILVALIFEYINGFHDTANAIATVVSTKVLTPRVAIFYSSIFNILGAFVGTHVAKTIGAGIVSGVAITQGVILCALLGAIFWNLLTWYFGLPSSSSHALVGGLLGASVAHSGFSIIQTHGLLYKVLLPMVLSPVVGIILGYIIMFVLFHLVRNCSADKLNYFNKLQIISAGFMAFSHGSNDAQKTMGIITLSLVSYGFLTTFEVPYWVILACAITMGFGTMAGGWKIIKTMGSKMFKMKSIHGFAIEMTASGIILMASFLGLPVSTTHVKTSAILGVGSTVRLSAVKWGVVGNILWAWVLTIPLCSLVSAGLYFLVSYL